MTAADVTAELDRLTAALLAAQAHPDYEYRRGGYAPADDSWERNRAAEDAEEAIMGVWTAAITLGLLLAVRFLP